MQSVKPSRAPVGAVSMPVRARFLNYVRPDWFYFGSRAMPHLKQLL